MSTTTRTPRRVMVRRVVSSVLLVVAVVGIGVAFSMHDDTPSSVLRPQAVRTVSPLPGTLQLRQTEIFVELDPTYKGSLEVNGTPIPDDQLNVIRGLNRYSFTPGPGRDLKSLTPGLNCVVVTYDLAVSSGDPGTYRWCFNVS